jgi:hypothetical protein
MARVKRTFWETKPQRPIRYGLFAQVADWWAGQSDGKKMVPQLPSTPREELTAPLATFYLDALNRRFQGGADKEDLNAVRDVADALVRSRVLKRDIAEREDRSRTIQKQLDAMPEVPDDSVLSLRNAVEQHADPVLIRARRLREYTAVRAKVLAAKDRADEEIRILQVEDANVSETIAVRKLALVIRVNHLLAHAKRRSDHYLRHLVRKHPDGPVLTTYFELSSPQLPDWLENWPAVEGTTAT